MKYKILGFLVGILIYIVISFAIELFILGAALGGSGRSITIVVILFIVAMGIPFGSAYFKNHYPNFLSGLLWGSGISLILLMLFIILKNVIF